MVKKINNIKVYSLKKKKKRAWTLSQTVRLFGSEDNLFIRCLTLGKLPNLYFLTCKLRITVSHWVM